MNLYKLYRSMPTVDVMRVDNVNFRNIKTDNSPMNRNVIKIHKGVDNEIRFRVFNPDRKPVGIEHLTVAAKLVNVQNGEEVLKKYLSISPQKGFMQMRIYEGELVNLAPGFYTLIILGEENLVPGKDDDNFFTPFYTDTGNNIVATVEIAETADRVPVPSYIIEPKDWRVVKQPGENNNLFADVDELHTKAIPASRVRNHINALHTFAVFTTNFTGTLQVMATLELQPPEQPRFWFPVDLTTGTDFVEFYDYTGSISFSFTANFMWLTFVQRPGWQPQDTCYGTPPLENGQIDKIILR